MGPLDILLGVLALASLGLMARNLLATGKIRVPVRPPSGEGPVYVRGRPVRPLIYTAGLPRDKPDAGMGARIAQIIRQSGLDATIAFTLLRADKPDLIRRLERDIERARLAYEATGSPRYRERLESLQKMYTDIARSTRPYVGGTTLIIWASSGQEAEARAVKTLIEAETGLSFREHSRGLVSALLEHDTLVGGEPPTLPLPWTSEPSENSVAIGVDPDYGGLVGLEWPRDFETHVGVIGPTGKGKTVLLLGIVMQLSLPSLPEPPAIVVIDPKGDLASMVSRSVPNARILSSAREACESRAVYIVTPSASEEGDSVIRELLDCYVRGEASHRTVLVVDEAWRFLSGDAVRYVESSVRQGRSLGLHIVYSTQSFDDISETIAENTGVLIVFGGTAESYRRKAARLGIPGEELSYLPVGTAILRRRGRTRRVRIFNFEAYLQPGTALNKA